MPSGKPILATGTPGGSTIITTSMQLLLNVVEFDMGVAEATAAPRIHHQWLPDYGLLRVWSVCGYPQSAERDGPQGQ